MTLATRIPNPLALLFVLSTGCMAQISDGPFPAEAAVAPTPVGPAVVDDVDLPPTTPVGTNDGDISAPTRPPPVATVEVPPVERFLVYLHGRGGQTWGDHRVANVPGYTNVTLGYDGSARLDDPGVVARVHEAIGTFCRTGRACVVVCHSAGCMRTLHALDHYRALKLPLNVLWVAAAGSAAGGTRLAELSSGIGFAKEAIDEDIRRDRARDVAGWAHIQDATVTTRMFHTAGAEDTCARPGLCGNTILPSGLCDGLVCVDSAGGASVSGSFGEGCAIPKYPGRIYDEQNAPCAGLRLNHTGVGDAIVDSTARSIAANR